MWEDKRRRKMVAVINCILNQNARAPTAAVFPGMNTEVVELLKRHEVGVLQMPCPEMTFLGLPRSRPEGSSIRDVLDTPEGRRCCRELSIFVVDQIQEYVDNNFQVLAVLGGDEGSPGCAVHLSSEGETGESLAEGSGVFMEELWAELEKRSINVLFRGVRDSDPEKLAQDISWLEHLLAETKSN